ncbi:choline uptake/conversion transcriptional regulator CudC [Bacillus taeanensis]|uniref:HTH-type transcriptional regulator n=1 Tax=Bacillus taeanensis TaxID=273032 RepID=A0A366Y2U2_9BACI|nr:GbsR/MarR family transcriptional regulator [Bacillus taeanensis]RBW70704.1 GbsR/MarR family transcriptional regulator [Bacillus taeanensis]
MTSSDKLHEAEAKIAEAKDIVTNSISETLDHYGIAPSIGRLYGTLYFEDKALTLDEMKEELGMSKPSMSTGVRKLQDIKMVHKVWQRGTRKDLYKAEKNFFKSFIQFFCIRWEREVEENFEAIEHSEKQLLEVINDEELPQHIREEAEKCYQQIHESRAYYQWLDKLVESFRSGEIFSYIPMEKEEK